MKNKQTNKTKKNKKKKEKRNMRTLFTLLRNVLLELHSKILLNTHTQKTFSCEKVSLFWIDFTSALSILQKLKVANNLITVLSF